MNEKNQDEDVFMRVQTARHPERPYTSDLLTAIFTDFVEIHGDRRYSDDAALICGFAKLVDTEVVVIGQQKGRDLNQRRLRNFGMPKPEGYRKALRVMKLAEKFGRTVITFIDTPGAYPGIDAEERGQAEAIAFNLREMANLRVPIIVVILGEGGSGGALAIGVGDRVLMLENAIYSVITPEGCAAILWKDASQAERAAECLRLTATNLKQFGLIDEVIPESSEWRIVSGEDKEEASAFEATAEKLKEVLLRTVNELSQLDDFERQKRKYEKFRKMGQWISEAVQ
jgi:acetyl-CoA carboxylase carboxyl transferase subunit alpha